MSKHVLLVEPAYRSKYPPLGLMKISQYHKSRKDHVEFVKGLSPQKRDRSRKWDRIYVATLFTYDWKHVVEALTFYSSAVKEPAAENLVVGGVLATLMGDALRETVECKVVSGLLDHKGKLGRGASEDVDTMLPDYGILGEIEYKYPVSDAYFAYATRGCIRRCPFCAVWRIEPEFKDFLPLAEQVKQAEQYGAKRDLVLLDNNVLASDRFGEIIGEIKRAGFAADARLERTNAAGRSISVRRRVDFNQGMDIRLLTEDKVALLAEIAIDPLRLAFDHFADKEMYSTAVHLAVKRGITRLSNYLLYNYDDCPEDLYHRLRLSVEMNKSLEVRLFSFPMRYVALSSKDRLLSTPGNVGPHWNRKYLRAIQCVLIPTFGAVTHRLDFFEAAFGKDVAEFHKILLMPEDYIIHRHDRAADGSTESWWRGLNDLTHQESSELLDIVLNHKFKGLKADGFSHLPSRIKKALDHYLRASQKQDMEQFAPDMPEALVAG